MGLEYLLVRVKENSNDDYKEYRGIDLIAIRINGDKKPMILRPIKLDEMEKFYKASYDSGMKDWISEDYEYCVWYLADEDCELQCLIEIDQIDIIRKITKEDLEEHNKNFEEFKKIHKFKERQKKMEDEIKEDEKCKNEFESQDEVNFEVRTKEGFLKVTGVIYKGFGIEKGWHAITILTGEFKGLKLFSCETRNVKKMIDDIREAIGEEDIKEENREVVINVLKKWRN